VTAGHERGSATVELVILAPVFGLLLALVVVAGRVGAARADVDGVAHSAAREIALARNPSGASGPARAEAAASLHEGSALCRSMAWRAEITAAAVTVSISCSVDLSGAALLPLPGSMTVSGTSTEVIDRFREATG
jgi:Flp pilus assembly protein TadG